MSLFGLFKKNEKNSVPVEPLDKLTPEGELPWGWLTQNTPICGKYESKIVDFATELSHLKGYERISQLERLIDAYNEFKDFCYGKDECYIKYFSDMWEHCHNSRCADFEYITRFVEEHEELKKNESYLKEEHERRTATLIDLDSKIIATLLENDGIMQSEFVKLFDSTVHIEVKDKLYRLSQEGKLNREKAGRSYILHLK